MGLGRRGVNVFSPPKLVHSFPQHHFKLCLARTVPFLALEPMEMNYDSVLLALTYPSSYISWFSVVLSGSCTFLTPVWGGLFQPQRRGLNIHCSSPEHGFWLKVGLFFKLAHGAAGWLCFFPGKHALKARRVV